MKTASVPWLERGPVEPKARTSGSRSATACECWTRGHGTETILIGPAEARYRTPGQRAFGRPKPRSSLPQSLFLLGQGFRSLQVMLQGRQRLLCAKSASGPFDFVVSIAR